MEQLESRVDNSISFQAWNCLVIFCFLWSSTVAIGSEYGTERSNLCRECTDLGLLNGVLVVKGSFEECSESRSSPLPDLGSISSGNAVFYRFNILNQNAVRINASGVSSVYLSADAGVSWSIIVLEDNNGSVNQFADGSYFLAVLAPLCAVTSPKSDKKFEMRFSSTQSMVSGSPDLNNRIQETDKSDLGTAGRLAAIGVGLFMPVAIILGLVFLFTAIYAIGVGDVE